MFKPRNNFAFIDGQNFYKSLKVLEKEVEALEVELDLSEFRTYLAEKHAAKTAYYFVGYIEKNISLYDHLKNNGYEPVYKEVATHEDKIKGNVDVLLTLRTLVEYNDYEKAVLITSDGDYACLAEYLSEQGKLECIIACSRGGCSYLLRKLHTKVPIYYLDDIIRDLYKRKETS